MTQNAPAFGTTYDQGLRPVRGWWRGVVALLLLVVVALGASIALGGAALVADLASGALDEAELESGALPITPLQLLATNLAMALLIPASLLIQRLLFRVPARALHSVESRFRWRWFGRLALVIVPFFVLYALALYLIQPAGEVRIDATALLFLAIVLLTTPLQAAGEEYGFRGLAQRSVGGWIASPGASFVVSTIASAALFCAFHFAGDPWLIAYYFLFGVALSIAAHGSGGLEGSVLVHAANNVVLFVPTAITGGFDAGIDRSMGAGGPFMLVPMVVILAAGLFVAMRARRSGVQRTIPAAHATQQAPAGPVE